MKKSKFFIKSLDYLKKSINLAMLKLFTCFVSANSLKTRSGDYALRYITYYNVLR